MAEPLDPAIGLLELESIAEGIWVGDAMVKRAPVEVLYAGTVHPGKYLVLVGGAVASVEEALIAALDDIRLLDRLFLPDVHSDVVAALRGHRDTRGDGEAIGIFETATVCATVLAADRGVKEAEVSLRDIHLADDLGGKAYCVFQGTVSAIESAIEAARSRVRPELIYGGIVIPQLADEMRASLDRAPRFADLLALER